MRRSGDNSHAAGTIGQCLGIYPGYSLGESEAGLIWRQEVEMEIVAMWLGWHRLVGDHVRVAVHQRAAAVAVASELTITR